LRSASLHLPELLCTTVPCLFLAIFFLWHWSLNSGPTPQATPPALFCFLIFILFICAYSVWVIPPPFPHPLPPALFCDGYFWDRVWRIICRVWLLSS
jgi:hypothetical protein